MSARLSRSSAAGWAAVVLLFVIAGWFFIRGMREVRSVAAPVSLGVAAIGRPLPDAPLTRLDGDGTTLRSHIGRPLWINFFATWCRPCKAELPEIERRYTARGGQGLLVLGIDQQESPAEVLAFAKRFHATYPMAIDQGPAAAAFDVARIPVSIFVDAQGTIRWIQLGQMSPAAMDSALDKILAR